MDSVVLVFVILGAIVLILTIIDGSWADTGWRLFQGSIVFGVYLLLRPHVDNLYAVVLIGAATAFVATAVAGSLILKVRRQ